MRTHLRITSLITLLTFVALLVPDSPAHADVNSGTVITVNTAIDDGLNGTCSLREAIRAANTDSAVDACPAGDGADTILLGAGTYQLSIEGFDDDAQTGDLDIHEDLVIRGAGMNSTIVDGGGIDRVFHIYWPDPLPEVSFERLTIQNGNVTTDRFGGAGIFNQHGTLTLREVSLQNNYSFYEGVEPAVGGGMDNLGTATLFDSFVSNNGADDGGGIFNDGTLLIYRSTLNNNNASLEEGGALDNSGTSTLEDVTINGNSAASGGGIFSDGILWISNTTLSGNTASVYGGALYNASDGTLENATISSNSATSGGGIYNTGDLIFRNTLMVNSLSSPNCAGSGSMISEGSNLEDTNTCNFNQLSDLPNVEEPLIGPLADNGGPTWTHALNWPSLAIDMGNDDTCPSTDQRGANRAGEHCDIGAYEYDGEFSIENVFLPLITR